MIGAYVVAVALLAAGAVIGFLALVSIGTHLDHNVRKPAPGRLTRGTRAVNGFSIRISGVTRETSHYPQDYRLANHEVDVIAR
jgi:hypothetical protein